MDYSIKQLFDDVINELKTKVIDNSDDPTYGSMLKQIEFVYSCELQSKNIVTELNGKKLNFGVLASKNLAGPEEALKEKIGEIKLYVINK